jgi:hypothetical protein
VDSYQKYQFAKNEPPCYNHGRNQSTVAEMIIRPIIETAHVQTLLGSSPENYQEDVLWPKKSPIT